MYAIHFRRNYHTKNDYTVIASGLTSLVQAKRLRAVSGDLVVHERTGEVVKHEFWLFDWERKDPGCYARRAQTHSKA